MVVRTAVRPAQRGFRQRVSVALGLLGLLTVGVPLRCAAQAAPVHAAPVHAAPVHAAPVHAVQAVPVDSVSELSANPPTLVPQLGPPRAPISIEVTGTLGGVCPAPLLRSLATRLADVRDVRLRFYPLRSTTERGEELLLTACEQQPSACIPFLIELCAHPAWLASVSDPAQSEELWRVAQRLGIDVSDLQTALRVHRHRRVLRALWEGPLKGQLVSDVRVNGKRIIGGQPEARIFDELDLQRERAAEALRNGVKPSALHAHLLDPRRDREDERRALSRFSPSQFGRLRESPRAPETVSVSVAGLPCQGPQIAPTTLVFVFHHDTFNAGAQARAVLDVWSRLRDRVRMCVMLSPVTPSARRVSELLAQVAAVDSLLFFRVLDELVELMSRRFFLRYEDVMNVLRRRGDLARVEAQATQGRVRVAVDRSQLQLLDLRGASYVIIGNRVLGSWNRDSLLEELTKETRRGLLDKLRIRTDSAKK